MCSFIRAVALIPIAAWTAYVSWVDLHTRRVPFGRLGLTILIITALFAVPCLLIHLPRSGAGTWFPYILLFAVIFIGRRIGAVGSGDVKLWAVWWLWTPPRLAWQGALVTSALWIFGGLFRLLVLRWPTGQKHPAAWVAALYGIWLTALTLIGAAA